MYALEEPYFDYENIRLQERLIEEVTANFKETVSCKRMGELLLESFIFAWQQGEQSAIDLAYELDLRQEHLHALNDDYHDMTECYRERTWDKYSDV